MILSISFHSSYSTRPSLISSDQPSHKASAPEKGNRIIEFAQLLVPRKSISHTTPSSRSIIQLISMTLWYSDHHDGANKPRYRQTLAKIRVNAETYRYIYRYKVTRLWTYPLVICGTKFESEVASSEERVACGPSSSGKFKAASLQDLRD